ncbi:SWAP/Surp superfamily [Arabidopsis suecica]|uniref:SWAP/Surp superfamily n=1 Tax=Arabidopsis suecica TaxID=45249 RepID=A0A8T2DP17_ARASU|nr:SWAP/Surp superfamily [Arabidopsis suecica]
MRIHMDKIARVVARKGLRIERKIMNVSEYLAKNQDEGAQEPEAPATLKGDAQHYRRPFLLSDPAPKFPDYVLPEGYTIEDVDTIFLTAQFVGRYGEEFWLDLIKEVDNKPQFEFLKPADSKFDYFNRLSVVASEGLKRSEKLTSSRMAIVSKAFFYHLRRQNEKRELTHKEGAAKACTLFGALYAFVGAHGCFADIKDEDLPLLQHPSAIKNILTASSNIHLQGSSTIMVSVPDPDDWKVVKITVQSLSENVASLKEKISGEIQFPTNKQKLRGKAGFLKDNTSLAHYNVGAGEILTLSWW